MLAGTVVLWDIDGTLVHSRGFGLQAFEHAVERATGQRWVPGQVDFGGRTDRDIAARILAAMGIAEPVPVAEVLGALTSVYEELAAELAAAVQVLPGVSATVASFAGRGALQTLVTGNVLPAAVTKVTAAGLADHLQIDLGGYGSDVHDVRADLVDLALDRVAATGKPIDRARVWLIGDTPRDLECARASGVRCALVATGTHDVDELRETDADLVLPDLLDATRLLDALAA